MSLVSKAEIRYEGFLHEIDTQNTTVTLKNVRSFGTENRRTDKVIQPKDDVFQYIIFRGTDIKDISVCENPIPPSFADPAIVQSGPPAAGGRQQPVLPTSAGSSSLTPDAVSPTPASFPPFAMPAMAQTKPHPPSVPSPQLFRDAAQSGDSQHISPEPLVDQSRSLSTVTDQSQSRGGAGGSSNQNRPQQHNQQRQGGYRNDRNENRSYSAATTRQQYNRGYNEYQPRSYTYNASGNPYNNYGGNNGYRNHNSGNAMSSGDRGSRPMGQNRNNYNYQNNYRWNQGGMNRRPGGGGPQGRMGAAEHGGAANQGDLKIDEEFDIDDANKKFDKSQLVKEFAGLNVQEEESSEAQVHNLADLEEGEVAEESRTAEAAKFYDKSKSFFDSISCDALEKKGSRLTTAEEKRLNLQTFGAPSVIRNRPNGPPNSYNHSGGFRPRSAGNYHDGGQGGPRNNYNRRGNYYGGFDKNASNYRRGPGNNSYYTSNYGASNNDRGNNNRQNNYYNRPQHQGNNQRVSHPAQA